MKRSMSTLIVLLLLSAPAFLFAGGGKDQAPAKGDKVVRILVYDDEWFDAVFKDFETKHPGFKVERKRGQAVDTGAITAMLSSSNPPDVLLVNSGPGRVGPLAAAGLIEDLTELYEKRGWSKNVTASILAILKRNDPKLWELCNGMDIFQVYYRKSLFQKAGASVPATWKDFLETADKLKKSGTLPLAVGVRDNYQGGWLMGTLFQSATDVDFMTALLYGAERYDNPNLLRAAENLKLLLDNGYIAKEAAALGANEAQTLFAAGKAAMIVAPQGNVLKTVSDGILDKNDLGSFLMPNLDGKKAMPTSGLSQSWILSKNTANREAALVFLDYVASADYTRKLSELNAWNYGVAAVKTDGSIAFDPVIKAAVDSAKEGAGYNPSVFQAAKVKTAYYAAIQAILSAQASPKDAMASIQAAKDGGK